MLGLLADSLRYGDLIGKFTASLKSCDSMTQNEVTKQVGEATGRMDIGFSAMALLRFNAAMDKDDELSKKLTKEWLESAPPGFTRKYRQLRDKRSEYYAHRGLLKKGKRKAIHTVTAVELLDPWTAQPSGIEWNVDPWLQDLIQRLSDEERRNLRELAQNAFDWVLNEFRREKMRVLELAGKRFGGQRWTDQPWVRVNGRTDGVTDELDLSTSQPMSSLLP